MQLSRQIGESFGVRISPHHLFAEPNIASLANKIRQSSPQVDRFDDTPREVSMAKPASDRSADEHYERILSVVEKLSDAEVEDLLRRLPD
jgi:hypothetical protein